MGFKDARLQLGTPRELWRCVNKQMGHHVMFWKSRCDISTSADALETPRKLYGNTTEFPESQLMWWHCFQVFSWIWHCFHHLLFSCHSRVGRSTQAAGKCQPEAAWVFMWSGLLLRIPVRTQYTHVPPCVFFWNVHSKYSGCLGCIKLFLKWFLVVCSRDRTPAQRIYCPQYMKHGAFD